MSISELLIKNSGWTWDRLREARKLGYQIGEESITDFLILNLKKYGRGKIIVKSFTRHAEAVNGADWEWWLTGPSGVWIGMRIQAKIINLNLERYEHLHHKNKYGFQVDQLVRDAMMNDLIPLYCMYTNWISNKYTTPKPCFTFKPSVRHFGISLLSTDRVKHFQRRNIRELSTIINDLLPIHCLFCCVGYGKVKADLPVRAFKYLKGRGLTKILDERKSSLAKILLKMEVPKYVKQVLNQEITESTKRNHNNIDIENDLDIPDDFRLKRVTVIQEIND